MMKSLEVSCTIADNAEEAIEIFQKTLSEGLLFDLVFVKLIIPGMSGFDAAKEIRQIEDNYELKKEERHFICGFAADVTECKYFICLKSVFRGEITV